ncbi:hypothetical protein HUO13_23710 [Saccharopolyspora erythraea]|uniref:hypothetical protein n=1 Tax=Saccharopolyspora erythraea TaxID=1836 RepID=UPI001BACBDFF|nr:hypothetical protein [Saccharopolyspora erythraea]QUH03428.1 hypothetical protein HUO13_23710 [Saccharopolyspora erythraea]
MGKKASDYRDDYTDPQLRERLKERIKASDKGGAPGRWSARKSQLLTQEYERQGGGYRHPRRRSRSQRDLRRWTEQDWRTASGGTRARGEHGTDRYLPREAWEELTPQQRRATRQAKRRDDRRGLQHSANPPAARAARKAAELDGLPAAEAVKQARRLGPDQARRAREHESSHKARKTVLRQLDRQIDRESGNT